MLLAKRLCIVLWTILAGHAEEAVDPSAHTCSQLGWSDYGAGDTVPVCATWIGTPDVCGSPTTDCTKVDITYSSADAHCTSQGARLCTAPELISFESSRSGCYFDTEFVWSQTPCGSGGHISVMVGSSDGEGATACNSSTPASRCETDDVAHGGRCCADAPAPTPSPTVSPTQLPSTSPTPMPTEAPYVCSSDEWGQCSCNGVVYYGRKYVSGQPGSGAEASFEQMKQTPYAHNTVFGSVQCNMCCGGGDPYHDFYKQCWCEPKSPTPSPTASPTESPTASPTSSPTEAAMYILQNTGGCPADYRIAETEQECQAAAQGLGLSYSGSGQYGDPACTYQDASHVSHSSTPIAPEASDNPIVCMLEQVPAQPPTPRPTEADSCLVYDADIPRDGNLHGQFCSSSDRIARHDNVTSLEDCSATCRMHTGCNYYSYTASNQGDCLLYAECSSGTLYECCPGTVTYAIGACQDEAPPTAAPTLAGSPVFTLSNMVQLSPLDKADVTFSDATRSFGFNGFSSYVTFERPIQDDFTILFEFRTTQSASSTDEHAWYKGNGLVDAESSGPANDFGIAHIGGHVMFGIGNPDQTIKSSKTYNDGQWHAVYATRERTTGTFQLAVDGELVGSRSGPTNSLTSTQYVNIGRIATNMRYFQGDIRDIRVYADFHPTSTPPAQAPSPAYFQYLGVGYAAPDGNRRCGTCCGASDTTSAMCQGSLNDGQLRISEEDMQSRCLQDQECAGYSKWVRDGPSGTYFRPVTSIGYVHHDTQWETFAKASPTTSPTPEPTPSPTPLPTVAPTSAPTSSPTFAPSPMPTAAPTPEPTSSPTPLPTVAPTSSPTPSPTFAPTSLPTAAPTPEPTSSPTPLPTVAPTSSPTPSPTFAPTPLPTAAPTPEPTSSPTPLPTVAPTSSPTPSPTFAPTPLPTAAPTPIPTSTPTWAPTPMPTAAPTSEPTSAPTSAPSPTPTASPTSSPTSTPTLAPTAVPTATPTPEPTATPTPEPTATPTPEPTTAPTSVPTSVPTLAPSSMPTAAPTSGPTSTPSSAPTPIPSAAPTLVPTPMPTAAPTSVPTSAPSSAPTPMPTPTPTPEPTSPPSPMPTVAPSAGPTSEPTAEPTSMPTAAPTSGPTLAPSDGPTTMPTATPTSDPTSTPTSLPTWGPTMTPTAAPTLQPTSAPTTTPTPAPSSIPTPIPTAAPTSAPTYKCGPIPTLNLQVSLTDECSSGLHDSQCAATCPPGWDLSGATILVCEFGLWQWNDMSPPVCLESGCMDIPDLLFGKPLRTCAGMEHGDDCEPLCLEGYSFTTATATSATYGLVGEAPAPTPPTSQAHKITCRYGQWIVPGWCIQNDVVGADGGSDIEFEEVSAIQVSFAFDPGELDSMILTEEETDEATPMSVDFAWAVANEDVIADSFAKSVGVLTGDVTIQIVPIQDFTAGARRLQSDRADRADVARSDGSAPTQRAYRWSRNSRMLQDQDLITYSSNAFGIKAIIVDRSAGDSSGSASSETRVKSNLEDLLAFAPSSNTTANATGDNSTASGGVNIFRTILQTELSGRGRPVPTGIQTVALIQKSPATIIPSFSVPIPKYSHTKWGACRINSASAELQLCGRGVQNRSVRCPRGAATGACGGQAKPKSEQECSDYSGCTFDVFCPLGPDPNSAPVECHQQTVAIMGTCGFFVVCIMCCCSRFCWVLSRQPKAGRSRIKMDDQTSVDMWWTLDRIKDEADGNEKERVVWAVGSKRVTEWFEKHADWTVQDEFVFDVDKISPHGTPWNAEIKTPQTVDVVWDINEEWTDDMSHADPGEGNMIGCSMIVYNRIQEQIEKAMPLMPHGSAVEYWSVSHHTWVLATLELDLLHPQGSNGTPGVQYNIHLPQQSVRYNVPMDCFRAPLWPVENVEVFSKRDGGCWLPGYITEGPKFSSMGYRARVEVDGQHTSMDSIPSDRIRRQFPANSPVEVYRAAPRGWVPAVVHQIAERVPAAPEALEMPPPLSSFSPSDYEYPMLGPWIYVPILEEERWCDQGVPEWVPSYLVRARSLKMVEDFERRRYEV